MFPPEQTVVQPHQPIQNVKLKSNPSLYPLFAALLAVPATGQVVFHDATSGPTGNTRLAPGTEFNPPLNAVTGVDNNWEQRTTFGSSGNIYEAGGEAAENAPELVTLITGLTPGASYNVRVHFWDGAGTAPDWNVRAGFAANPGANTLFANPADAADLGATAAVLASTLTYTTAPSVFVEADRTMFAGTVGIAIADSLGQISVYIDDRHPTIAANNRTWYDGLSTEVLADSDNDTLPDLWETANGLDPDDATGDNGPGGNPDNDGLTNFEEYALFKTKPTVADTDGDTLLDGPEHAGTSNAFNGVRTNPNLADSDADGLSDAAENSYPTNPNAADTDNDGMPDGYELANQTPGTALNPLVNDAATDNDGDGLSNLEEFNPALGPNPSSVQTRADLADTDGDGLNDRVEDNLGTWGSTTLTGTNPTRPDTDGDGLTDSEENQNLGTYAGSGIKPAWSDPTLADTDGDQFADGYEVEVAGTDPQSIVSVPTQPTGFQLVEDFEGTGMTIGQTIDGVNGWKVANNPPSVLIADEPLAGGDQVAALTKLPGAGGVSLYKSLAAAGLQVLEGNTGTLFFQLQTGAGNHDNSFGLSDQATPAAGDFPAFEAQAAVITGLVVRDGAVVRATGDYPRNQWMNVWVMADNAADQVRVWVESPVGGTGQVEITNDGGVDPFNFRNGTVDALATALFIISPNGPDNGLLHLDNLYVDAKAMNLTTPAAAKPTAGLSILSVGFQGGDLKIRFAPAGTGYVLTSSDDLATPFTPVPAAIFDGVDTFTVPAAALNPGKDFFRVETP